MRGEKEKKKKDTKTKTGVVVKKNKRTGKYYEKEVEVRGSGSRINLQKSYSDNWDEGLYSYSNYSYDEPKETKSIRTLQEYLNQKYPTKKDKMKVEDISIDDINKERNGLELLEGEKLDLREYINLDWLSVSGDKLKSPLTDINLEGLNKIRSVHLVYNSFSFNNVKTLWDKCFLINAKKDFSAFSLIKFDELTKLAYQLNEENWKDLSFIKHFGVSEEELELWLDEEIESDEQWERDKKEIVYTLLDNLNNQVIARCVIVSNRLTHGINNKEEDKIMELALGFQYCSEIEGYLKEKDENKIKELVDKALMSDKELLSRLQDLPWECPQLETRMEYPMPGSWPNN